LPIDNENVFLYNKNMKKQVEEVDVIALKYTYDPMPLVYKLELGRELDSLINCLTEREQKIICMRFGLRGHYPTTLQEVAREFGPGVTRERIRQIQNRAISKMGGKAQKCYLTSELISQVKKVKQMYKEVL
jgi:RNA polymerase sigma factor (sigma-70 family)